MHLSRVVVDMYSSGARWPLKFFVRIMTTPIGPTAQTRKCGCWIVSRLLSASVIPTINHTRLRETCMDLDNVSVARIKFFVADTTSMPPPWRAAGADAIATAGPTR